MSLLPKRLATTPLKDINITVISIPRECLDEYWIFDEQKMAWVSNQQLITTSLANYILRIFVKEFIKGNPNNVELSGYFFDDNGVYSHKKIMISCSDYYDSDFDISTTFSPITYIHQKQQHKPATICSINGINICNEWMHAAITTLKLGDTWADLLQRYNILENNNGSINSLKGYYPYRRTEKDIADKNTCSVFSSWQHDAELDRFLTRINEPIIERDTDNPNRNTFDFIRVRFGILSKTTCPNRIEFIKSHRKDIAKIAVNKIQSSKKFQKYNVPVNYLKLNRMAITPQNELELLFVLKQ